MIAFSSILLVAFLGFAGAPMWTLLLGVSVLFAISLVEKRRLTAHMNNLAKSDIFFLGALASLSTAVLASGSAFGLGWGMFQLMTL